MKSLLKKDAYFVMDLKPQLLILIICVVSSLIITKHNPDFSIGFINSYVVVVCSIVAASTISYDEENEAMAYLMSMAISRKTYVNSKYLLSLIIAFAGGILVTLLYFAIQIISGQAPQPLGDNELVTVNQFISKLFLIHIGATSLSLIFSSISIPSFLKYGSKKGVWVTMLGLVVVGIIIFGAGTLLENMGFSPDAIIASAIPKNITHLSVICVVFAVVCMITSNVLSQTIIRAKEF